MPRPGTSQAPFEPQTGGPLVRRSWKLVPGPHGPLLTGFFGFPWREPVLQAKCTDTELAGASQLAGKLRVDRWHQSVPSLDCTCGIYASDEPVLSLLQRANLRSSVIVNGFVRLSGRVLMAGATYRAEQAQIVGPLTINLPPRRRIRRLGARWGLSQQVCRVTEDVDGWLFWYSRGRRGISLGEWHKQMSEAIRRRYDVEVVGLLVPLLGPS